MHFSIPNTQELKEENGATYQAFNIHINGVLHCVLRYSQLRDLNEQLRVQFPTSDIVDFPPKRVFSLTGDGLKDRRLQLERYIQSVSQNQDICHSKIFNTFLHRAQQETRREESVPVSLDVYLLNGAKVTLDIRSTDQTNEVLKIAAAAIGIPDELVYYFGLYMVKQEEVGKWWIVRKMQEFESPYISMKGLADRRSCKLTIRKTYWDQEFDNDLSSDTTTFRLLHIQALNDVEMGWTVCPKETKLRIESLESKGSKRECLKLCQTLQHYGYIQFKPCITDFPEKKCRVIISMGNYEIHFRVRVGNSQVKETVFSVTRMRCWRVSSQFEESDALNKNENRENPVLQISFEYLISKGALKWVSIISDQAIMISMCIKDMVDELLRKRTGGKIRKPHGKSESGRFKPRDRSAQALFGTEKSSEPRLQDSDRTAAVDSANQTILRTPFEGIGDEDL